jgi:capsular polysaccharide biosynthesis protein
MRRLLLLGVLLGALAGLAAGLHLDRAPVVSESQVVLSVGPAFRGSTDAVSTEDQYLSDRMTTYAELALSDRVLGPVAQRMGTTAGALRPFVTVTTAQNSNVLDVAVQAATPDTAAAVNRAVDESLASTITALETRPGAAPPISAAADPPPTVPAAPFTPPLGLATAAGALAGLVVALLAAAARATGLPQRATRGLLSWLFSTPDQRGPLRPPAPVGPVATGEVSVPEQVRPDSAADADPTRTSSSSSSSSAGV